MEEFPDPGMGQGRKKKEKRKKKKRRGPFFEDIKHQMETRVVLVCVGFLEANICLINWAHWVCASGFCL